MTSVGAVPHFVVVAESQRGVALLAKPTLRDHYRTVMWWPNGHVKACYVQYFH